mmetsp:Transcript_58236/g.138725  ORF Transcript_58236/g.138725 Transcript_58236/m.138725 type:complete len:205 (+) Transcript_58236:2266-2880(+)
MAPGGYFQSGEDDEGDDGHVVVLCHAQHVEVQVPGCKNVCRICLHVLVVDAILQQPGSFADVLIRWLLLAWRLLPLLLTDLFIHLLHLLLQRCFPKHAVVQHLLVGLCVLLQALEEGVGFKLVLLLLFLLLPLCMVCCLAFSALLFFLGIVLFLLFLAFAKLWHFLSHLDEDLNGEGQQQLIHDGSRADVEEDEEPPSNGTPLW